MKTTKKQLNRAGSFGKTTSQNPYEGRVGLVYARVSSKKQEIEGTGLGSQEGRCKSDLLSLGVPYTDSFLDSYPGGGDFMNRPAMRDMLAYIDARPYKKFLVSFDDLKRFARDVEFHIKLRAAFAVRDVTLRCLNYNFDESPEGRFAELIMAGQGQLEREQNRRQVIQKMIARMELGYWPFCSKKGYDITKDPLHGKLCIPNHEGAILKRAMEDFSHGVFVRKIDACRFLVEQGFWKKQKPEKYIDKFDEMLRDPFYAGYIEYTPWEVERRIGKHDGIISLETHELIQKRLRREGLGKRIRLDMSADFPLRGLLVCDHCGGHITGAWSQGRKCRYPYYACQNRTCEYYGKSIPKADIESGFTDLLKRNALKPEVEKILIPLFDRIWKEETDALKKQGEAAAREQSRLEEKARTLTEMVIAAKSDTLRSAYERQLEATAEEIENSDGQTGMELDLSIPYRTALGKATGLLKNPLHIWEKLETTDQHKLFYFMFEQKLPYHRTDGYRTAKIACAARLFEEFATANSPDVDITGIEPVT